MWPLVRTGFGWGLILSALAVVVIALFYVPIMGPSLQGARGWVAAGLAMVLIWTSLYAHRYAHDGMALVTRSQRPERVPLFVLGDPAQIWPLAATPAREAAVALAGPMLHLLLALIAYLVWDWQLHPILNVATSLVALVNLGLGLLNLAPGYPMDGGRVVRALGWGLFNRPDAAHRLARWLGGGLVLALALWGLVLVAQPVRFGRETGIATLIVALGLGIALWPAPAVVIGRGVEPAEARSRGRPLRLLLLALVLALQMALPAALLPTLNGLYMPGFAVPVESMVVVPAEHRHDSDGTFVLTTVITQAPSVLGQWVYAQFDPAVSVVEPSRVVPEHISPQEQVARTYRMLDESTLTAKVVALRLAGYDARLTGKAVEVVAVVAESPARGLLQPGDRITHVNGERVRLVTELTEQLRAAWPEKAVRLRIERAGQSFDVITQLIPPSGPDALPRLGISAQTVGLDAFLPFPVEINPKKIVGGPSAGLMFTLAVYDALTPEDLTAGYRIAGTGTITTEGRVGPIGGVEQKVAGAERAGAAYFLVPDENYEDARRVARSITVVPVSTVDEAITFLRGLPPLDPVDVAGSLP